LKQGTQLMLQSGQGDVLEARRAPLTPDEILRLHAETAIRMAPTANKYVQWSLAIFVMWRRALEGSRRQRA